MPPADAFVFKLVARREAGGRKRFFDTAEPGSESGFGPTLTGSTRWGGTAVADPTQTVTSLAQERTVKQADGVSDRVLGAAPAPGYRRASGADLRVSVFGRSMHRTRPYARRRKSG